jgi:hypothetical protein
MECFLSAGFSRWSARRRAGFYISTDSGDWEYKRRDRLFNISK